MPHTLYVIRAPRDKYDHVGSPPRQEAKAAGRDGYAGSDCNSVSGYTASDDGTATSTAWRSAARRAC